MSTEALDVAEEYDTVEIVGSGNWTKAPDALLVDKEMGHVEVRVYLLIRSHGNESKRNELAFPGQQWMAETLNVHRNTVGKAVRALQQRGWIGIVKTPCRSGFRNHYKVHDTPDYAQSTVHPSLDNAQSAVHSNAQSAVQEQEPVEQEPKKKSADADVVRLCEVLAAKITERSGKTPKIGQRWHTDMRLLIERGPTEWAKPERIPPEKVARLVEYVFRHDDRNGTFCWADQVRSPDALRRHWEKLRVWANGHKQEDADDDTAWMASGATRKELGLPLVERP